MLRFVGDGDQKKITKIPATMQNSQANTKKIFTNSSGQVSLNGGVSNGGVSRSGLVLPFLSLFVLFGTFPIFPGFS